jgi:two-component system, sensor histidine kinase
VRLPKSLAPAALVSAAPEITGTAGQSILLIEDGPDAREVMTLLLNSLGHEVIAVPNGSEGIRAAEEALPGIAIVDIGLPGMSGYQVAQQLRANPATRHMKLIALTGYGLEQDRLRALEAGFDFHLVKPVAAKNLIFALEQCQASTANA